MFTGPLYELLNEYDWHIDAVIPVPLGVARLQERGYNQAVLITQPLALRIGKPCLNKGLIRVRETAFRGVEEIVSGLHVLVVDDVATSSATLNACAGALLEAGSQEVRCLTLARAN
jgi:predicted amidophosphoribosyltransferase